MKSFKNMENTANTRFPPFEYEWVCISCGCNVRKRKRELSKKLTKKVFLQNKIYVQHKIFRICRDV